jgi:hypothetical protein
MSGYRGKQEKPNHPPSDRTIPDTLAVQQSWCLARLRRRVRRYFRRVARHPHPLRLAR